MSVPSLDTIRKSPRSAHALESVRWLSCPISRMVLASSSPSFASRVRVSKETSIDLLLLVVGRYYQRSRSWSRKNHRSERIRPVTVLLACDKATLAKVVSEIVPSFAEHWFITLWDLRGDRVIKFFQCLLLGHIHNSAIPTNLSSMR